MRTLPLALVLAACARPGAYKRYRVESIALTATRAELVAAVKRHAWLHDWELVRADEATGELELLSRQERHEDVATRQRWTLHVGQGTLGAELALELFDGTRWLGSRGVVCGTYDYAQERALLAEIEAVARRGRRGSRP